ncbi:hypothetical protein [Halobellus sp. H-GB7]|uniref:hypothetical protein n=1 Tax=Halobellus sp. H-GB7 TaxID=3069756 RepID=UPI0027B36B1B|nr:hypothetical protein [Halobellus sp. H-GB7]MDQ2055518.1 hypothetical protein [Halobellus sp. H-GB7]
MQNSRRPIAPAEQDVLDHLEAYVDAADTDSIARETAIAYLTEQGLARADASDIIEQLLLKGYLYEVGEELRIPPRW